MPRALAVLRFAFENWLRIGIESKKANYINAGHSLGKGEVVSSILTGSTIHIKMLA
jgi:hypothetical protein